MADIFYGASSESGTNIGPSRLGDGQKWLTLATQNEQIVRPPMTLSDLKLVTSDNCGAR